MAAIMETQAAGRMKNPPTIITCTPLEAFALDGFPESD
jgi:hypothetical protein